MSSKNERPIITSILFFNNNNNNNSKQVRGEEERQAMDVDELGNEDILPQPPLFHASSIKPVVLNGGS